MYIDQLDLPRAEEALRLRMRSYGVGMLQAVRAPDAEQDQLPPAPALACPFRGQAVAPACLLVACQATVSVRLLGLCPVRMRTRATNPQPINE